MKTEIEIRTDKDVLNARRQAKLLAQSIAFDEFDVVRLVTVVSELARNIIKYAESGSCELSVLKGTGRTRVRCVFRDSGPGFRDLDAALRDGYSTGRTLGKGLPGVKRIADRFTVKSTEKGSLIEVELAETRVRKATAKNG